MTIQLPADGFEFIRSFLFSFTGGTLIAFFLLLALRAFQETEPVRPLDRTRCSFPPVSLIGLITGYIGAELALSLSGWQSSVFADLFLRNLLVLALIYLITVLLTSRFDSPSGETIPFAGRIQPAGRLFLLGLVGFLGLGLTFWGGSGWLPLDIRLPELSAVANPLLYLVFGIMLVPLTEELIFRGYLYPLCRERFGIVLSVFTVSLIFVFAHGTISHPGPVFLGSLVMTVAYEISGSVLPGLIIHAGFNGLILTGSWWFSGASPVGG